MNGKLPAERGLAVKAVRPLSAFLFWLIIWQLAAAVTGSALILPSPASVVRALLRLIVTGAFWLAAGASLLRIVCGFAAGSVIGAVLAVLTAASGVCKTLFSPAIRVIRATPVASFIILVLLWTARALVPGIISCLMVIPVVWGQLSAAIEGVDQKLLEMAAAYRFGTLKKLKLIYIPSVLPHFTSACLTAQGLAWKSGIAAEVLCLPKSSVGTRLYYSKLYLNTDELFAWTLAVILLSFALEAVCKRLLRGAKP